MSKIVAIMDGGDWYDASVEHLIVPDGVNLGAEARKWRRWYRDIYCPHLRQGGSTSEFMSFSGWLTSKCGARETEGEEVIEFWAP